MTTSRRTFLKGTVAGASAAWQELHKLKHTSGKSVDAIGRETNSPHDSPEAGPDTGVEATEFTRGPGIYPGNPSEDFGPVLVKDESTYRNLALHRPAYHSSSYDYNLTAQLVTDGIKETHLPDWVVTSASLGGEFSKIEREFFLDHNPTSTVDLRGPRPWVQVQLGGGKAVPQVDRVDLLVVAPSRSVKPEDLSFTVLISDDGREWKKAGSVPGPKPSPVAGYPMGFAQPGQLLTPSIPLSQVAQSRFYRIELGFDKPVPFSFGIQWRVGLVAFFHENQRVEIGGPYNFTSAWMSAGLGEEWVYVDLGTRCEFDRVMLHWIARAAEGSVQVSDDAANWKDILPLPGGTSLTDDLELASPAQGRYVRVLMNRPTSPDGYILSEFEVYGRGGLVPRPKPAPEMQAGGRLHLAGGAWRLQRDSLVAEDGEKLSQIGFHDDDWEIATVPGTVLSSYLNVGAIPDPNYGENQLFISDFFFYADFWYRNEFTAPPLGRGERAWINFDGVNWKAEVFLNGAKLGRIEGGFMRGRFDVTGRLSPGQKNAIAVRVEKNDTPGSVKQKTFESSGKNGGALGVDNPTFHASIGWDWIPTIRGRNSGIWNDVYLTVSGPVTVENPSVTTALQLPNTSRADVSVEVDLINHDSKPVKGTLRGRLGKVEFEQRVEVEASARAHLKLDPSTHPSLRLENPRLWWPAGYGDPDLYDLEVSFEEAGRKISDTKSLKVGVRQMSYKTQGGALKIWVNGRRFVPRGGNWGFSESMLRYRAREYDAAVRYHREMNFTMIRNWVGQIGEDEFYEACDRHGIMVWQDFWLANPWDGEDPKDADLFMSNVKDTILRIRNHPCIGLYCGRNEGYPPKPLEEGIRAALAELHPGIQYIPSSADDTVTGHGPYMAMPLNFYFTFGASTKLHSEMGMPNIPTIESVRAMMPEASLWPQGLAWGLHDFCLRGAQGGGSFNRTIESGFGGANGVEEWIWLAQFVNYQGYRAMFEAQSKHRMGLLIWMSHPCWPSFVWQTYDYYLEPTAAYFGCKKASEPLHIQWNPASESIEVVNYSAGDLRGLTAQVEVLNMDGTPKWRNSATLDSAEDSVATCIPMAYPSGLTPVHFLRLKLSLDGKILSENFYLRGREEGNFKAIRGIPKIKITSATNAVLQDGRWQLTTELSNPTAHPALMVRLKAVREKSGDRILPALYSDNYVFLMPGEQRTVRTELWVSDARGEKPRMLVDGFNVGTVLED
jgi:Glycosyl hydrolase 2 galactose-binding domain-like/Exo-beta-D-glucosaminidase Ig-fold domain/Glycosyl hydrolases family 2/NedA-like, galactose-binding domain